MEQPSPDAVSDWSSAIGLLDDLVSVLGPGWTVVLLLVGYFMLKSSQLWEDWRADEAAKRREAEHERAVQRAANEAREFRIAVLIDKFGWTEERVRQFIMLEQVDDGESSRRQIGNQARLKVVENVNADVEGA